MNVVKDWETARTHEPTVAEFEAGANVLQAFAEARHDRAIQALASLGIWVQLRGEFRLGRVGEVDTAKIAVFVPNSEVEMPGATHQSYTGTLLDKINIDHNVPVGRFKPFADYRVPREVRIDSILMRPDNPIDPQQFERFVLDPRQALEDGHQMAIIDRQN